MRARTHPRVRRRGRPWLRLPRHLAPGADRRSGGDPDPRQRRDGAATPGDCITRPRTETSQLRGPRREHGGRPLRDDGDAQRVREGPVVARADDRRKRVDPAKHGRAVESDEGPPAKRRKRLADLPCDRRGPALHLDPVDREERRLAREQVAAERERRGCRGRPPSERRVGATPREPRPRTRFRPRHVPRSARRVPHARWTGEADPAGIASEFGAGLAAPTARAARAARARRGTRPRARACTPNCSRARRRASAMSASASAVVAPSGVLDEVRVLRRDLGAADCDGP